VLGSETWDTAKQRSEEAGGHLVTITSKEESDFVFNLFSKDERFVSVDSSGSLNGPWIGLFQADGAREPSGGWQWVTGEPFTFKNWSPWAPDNHSAGENYGRYWGRPTGSAMLKRAGVWDDGQRQADFRFIVEVD